MAKANISQRQNLLVFILMTISNLENTLDKALTPMFFKPYEELGYSSSQLGRLSMIQMGTFFMALPLWSVLVSKYSFRDLLIVASFTWGCGTYFLGSTTDYYYQCLFRVPTGIALAATVPIGQSVYSELCDTKDLGKLFGAANFILYGVTGVKYYVGYSYNQYWMQIFQFTGMFGIAYAFVLYCLFPNQYRSSKKTTSKEVIQEMCTMAKEPVIKQFLLQAFLNGVGFQAITFMGLWWQNIGFTAAETGLMMCIYNLFVALGTFLGGWLGDFFDKRAKQKGSGRITVAQISLFGRCLPFLLLFTSPVRNSYINTMVTNVVFALISSWVAVCATRPMVSEMLREPAERGQAMAVIRVFTTIGSFVGAPAVGTISGFFGYIPEKKQHHHGLKFDSNGVVIPEDNPADILGYVVAVMACGVWVLSSLYWLTLYRSYPIALEKAETRNKVSKQPGARYGRVDTTGEDFDDVLETTFKLESLELDDDEFELEDMAVEKLSHGSSTEFRNEP